jgi:hypothetical protein
MKVLILALVFFAPGIVFAGTELVKDAKVTAISNTNDNEKRFTIWVSGGSGPCLNSSISFPATAAGSPEVYQRAYATALMAYASGDSISAHDYYSSNCHNAAYIRVSK